MSELEIVLDKLLDIMHDGDPEPDFEDDTLVYSGDEGEATEAALLAIAQKFGINWSSKPFVFSEAPEGWTGWRIPNTDWFIFKFIDPSDGFVQLLVYEETMLPDGVVI